MILGFIIHSLALGSCFPSLDFVYRIVLFHSCLHFLPPLSTFNTFFMNSKYERMLHASVIPYAKASPTTIVEENLKEKKESPVS